MMVSSKPCDEDYTHPISAERPHGFNTTEKKKPLNSWLKHNVYFGMAAKIIVQSNLICDTLNCGQRPPSLLQIQYHVALEIPPAICRALIFGQVCRKCTATPK